MLKYIPIHHLLGTTSLAQKIVFLQRLQFLIFKLTPPVYTNGFHPAAYILYTRFGSSPVRGHSVHYTTSLQQSLNYSSFYMSVKALCTIRTMEINRMRDFPVWIIPNGFPLLRFCCYHIYQQNVLRSLIRKTEVKSCGIPGKSARGSRVSCAKSKEVLLPQTPPKEK